MLSAEQQLLLYFAYFVTGVYFVTTGFFALNSIKLIKNYISKGGARK